MLTEDHLIRMINIAIAALLRILGLKKNGDYLEALQLIDLTIEQLLGLPSTMARNLDDEKLYYLLTRGDVLDIRRLAIIAELYKAEGDILAETKRGAESREDYIRALRYFMEVFFNTADEGRGEIKAKIEEILRSLDTSGLESNTLWPLAGYYEETGAYGQAEAVLLRLVEQPQLREEIRPELVAFYERILEKNGAALQAGGIDSTQARERLAHWQNP